jgi:hypothetical protein
MPYVGNSPASNFASVTKDTFSGDGSTVAFTLSKAATTNGVAVFVENVRQEPTTAYAVSGTTLTFTAAPVSASGNNIYVMHHNTPASTATHPAAQALTATTGTFTSNGTFAGTLGVTGTTKLGEIASIGQATPLSPNDATSFLHIGDNNNQDTSIILEDAVEIWEIYQNDTLSFRRDTTIVQELHRDGHVTQPLQPCFQARPTSTISNIAHGSSQTLAMATEVFDQNADYDNSNYTFTAPVTGKYLLTLNLRVQSLDVDGAYFQAIILTSNKEYQSIISTNRFSADPLYWYIAVSVVADMDAADTALPRVFISSSAAAQVDIETDSYFSGCLLA